MQNTIQRVTETMQSSHVAAQVAHYGVPAKVRVNNVTRAITWTVNGVVVALTQYSQDWAIACYIDASAEVPAGYKVIPVVCDGDKFAFVCAEGFQHGAHATAARAARWARLHHAHATA